MSRLFFGHVPVDVVTFEGALDAIETLAGARRGGRVFTPNVDHVMLAEENADFRRAYGRASLCLADGMPLVVLSRLTGRTLPAKVSGSDLISPLAARAAARGLGVYLFGGANGVAERAARRLLEEHPRLRIVGTSAPVVDERASDDALRALAAPMRESKADIVFVALGAPKQEIFIDRIADHVAPAVLVGVGASFDFLAGTAKRAPRWMSQAGLEWLHRLAHDPKRLFARYVLRDGRLPLVLARHKFPLRAHSGPEARIVTEVS